MITAYPRLLTQTPMSAIVFDTLKFAKRLRDAGFTEQQVEALAAEGDTCGICAGRCQHPVGTWLHTVSAPGKQRDQTIRECQED